LTRKVCPSLDVRAGAIILAAAACTAMVFVWSYPTAGDPTYILVHDYVNGKAYLLSNLVQGWSITDTVDINNWGVILAYGAMANLRERCC
jgi:ACR3 family arsenite efflux pump ArsB